jgi:hypothetical protein
MKYVVLTFLALLMASTADAAMVGVVIDFQNGDVDTYCADVADNAGGFDVLDDAGISHTEDNYGGQNWFITTLNGINPTSYWSMWIQKAGDSTWDYSPVGIDGNLDCWNRGPTDFNGHYCAVEGDVIGFSDEQTWGSTKPERIGFCEICDCESGGRGKRIPRVMGYFIKPVGVELGENDSVEEAGEKLTLTGSAPFEVLLVDEKTQKPVRNAVVEIFSADDVPGIHPPAATGKTQKDGRLVFELERGDYVVRVSGTQYPHLYIDINVLTTTTTSTTVPQTTSTILTTSTTVKVPETTTTTLDLPKHIDMSKKEKPKPKRQKPLVIGKAVEKIQEPQTPQPSEDGGGLIGWLLGFFV